MHGQILTKLVSPAVRAFCERRVEEKSIRLAHNGCFSLLFPFPPLLLWLEAAAGDVAGQIGGFTHTEQCVTAAAEKYYYSLTEGRASHKALRRMHTHTHTHTELYTLRVALKAKRKQKHCNQYSQLLFGKK